MASQSTGTLATITAGNQHNDEQVKTTPKKCNISWNHVIQGASKLDPAQDGFNGIDTITWCQLTKTTASNIAENASEQPNCRKSSVTWKPVISPVCGEDPTKTSFQCIATIARQAAQLEEVQRYVEASHLHHVWGGPYQNQLSMHSHHCLTGSTKIQPCIARSSKIRPKNQPEN
jgi:hypothetical protein